MHYKFQFWLILLNWCLSLSFVYPFWWPLIALWIWVLFGGCKEICCLYDLHHSIWSLFPLVIVLSFKGLFCSLELGEQLGMSWILEIYSRVPVLFRCMHITEKIPEFNNNSILTISSVLRKKLGFQPFLKCSAISQI